MKNKRDPWIQVRDESELREGMAVQMRTCTVCNKKETAFISKRLPYHGLAVRRDGSIGPQVGSFTYRMAGRCAQSWGFDVAHYIPEGRLYRLADDQLADDTEPTTVVRGREMERAR